MKGVKQLCDGEHLIYPFYFFKYNQSYLLTFFGNKLTGYTQEKGLTFLELLTHATVSSCSSASLNPRQTYKEKISKSPTPAPPYYLEHKEL